MSDEKTVWGRGRLTEERITKFQRYYGNAIKKYPGNLQDMQNAIWVLYHHSILPRTNTPVESQHKFCQKGESSWCKFNSDMETGRNTYVSNCLL